jgi:hypothetical protein
MLRAVPPASAESRTEDPQKELPVKEKSAPEKPAAKGVTIRGKVVDDATGEPIGKLII